MKTLDEALDMYGFRFSGKTTDKQKEELNKFWDKAFAGKTASSAEEIAVLESFGTCDFVRKCKADESPTPAKDAPARGSVLFTLALRDGRTRNTLTGEFIMAGGALSFEYALPEESGMDDGKKAGEAPQDSADGTTARPGNSAAAEAPEKSAGPKTALAPLSDIDVRIRQLLEELCSDHVRVKLRGFISAGRTFAATQIHVLKDAQAGKDTMDEAFLQTMLRRLLTAQVFPEEAKKDDISTEFDDFESAQRFARLAGITLPVTIRRWTERTLRTLESPLLGADERTHAKRALTMMMNIRWESTDFSPIDPWKAKQILDEELYGLETVKQRVVETIIQINRTHTLPSYGLLLVGPPGTGKSRLAYAVGRILKLPTAVLDMSTIRDPEALTGSPRVYINAKPGKIMEAFSKAGQSNIVFIINELDKADSEGPHGNPSDVLLTLLDNLGFTDVYMECAIPTGGVYSIATANEKDRISGPLLSRFSLIEIPDYTPDEKRIIFTRYSMPRVLKRMGMSPSEVVLTDDAVDAVIRRFEDRTGCRELEQAAEHIAGNALFRIETEETGSVTFGADDVLRVLDPGT
ncbi:MAG: AAA family ATPase [Eubacteriales bacterium]|nr:AAA family ATPase [Eubacteriales bacterium]